MNECKCSAPSLSRWLLALFALFLFGQITNAAPPTPGAVRGTLPKKDRLQPLEDHAPIEMEAPKPARPSGPMSTKTIHIEQFLLHGNTAISSSELIAEVQPFLGQDLTLNDLYTVADILTDYYRAKGYSLAQVVVPAQRVEAGIVRLDVIEGEINAVLFEGNKRYTNKFLQPFFANIKPGSVVSIRSLERELLLVNDLPGFSSRALVQPGPKYGTTDLVIKGQEDLVQGRVAANNYGREDIGEWRIEGDITINNPLRQGDRLTLTGIHSESNLLNYVSLDYSIALNGKGTRAAVTASYFDFDVGADLSDLDIDGTNYYAHLLITHPLQRSRRRNILIGTGISFNKSKQRVFGKTTKDADLALLDFNLLVNWLHKQQAYTTARGSVFTNFQDSFDGTDNDQLEAKLEVEIDHLRAIAPNWFLYVHGLGVYSWDPLPDTEKLDLGGINNVRGYGPSEVRGDRGGSLTLELRRRLLVKNLYSATVSVFGDTAIADRIRPFPGEKSHESITSVGIGLTASYTDQYVVDLSFALPTDGKEVNDGRGNGRAWLNISAYF